MTEVPPPTHLSSVSIAYSKVKNCGLRFRRGLWRTTLCSSMIVRKVFQPVTETTRVATGRWGFSPITSSSILRISYPTCQQISQKPTLGSFSGINRR